VSDNIWFDLFLDDRQKGVGSIGQFTSNDEGQVMWDVVGAMIVSDCQGSEKQASKYYGEGESLLC